MSTSTLDLLRADLAAISSEDGGIEHGGIFVGVLGQVRGIQAAAAAAPASSEPADLASLPVTGVGTDQMYLAHAIEHLTSALSKMRRLEYDQTLDFHLAEAQRQIRAAAADPWGDPAADVETIEVEEAGR